MADDISSGDSTPIPGRRVTRQSTRRVSAVDSEKENPYRKPTYQPQGNGESSNDSSSKSNTSSSHTPASSGGRARGGGRGRQSQATKSVETTPAQPTPSRGRGSRGPRGGSARGSATKRPGRPECIASSGRSSKKKKKRKSYYNTTDYHYGSDFEEEEDYDDLPEDEEEEEIEEEPPSPSASSLNDDLDMDIDDTSSNSGLPSSSAPEPIYVPPAIPTENLNLPKSSEDLLIDKDLVIRALAIYEPLRRFSNLVRLTQFRFEEFCGAVSNTDEQSLLLVEIHIQLLKALLREDDAQSTTFGPPELKDSIQSIFYFIDSMTWPETLRMYLESDPSFEAPEIPAEYPFSSVESRLDVLTTLVNQFLAITPVRDSLSTEVIKHEDHCRSCARLGELICCETCPAVYHLECIETAHKKDWDAGNPPDQWKCGICKKDELTGTADCISELESAGLLIRQEKLGYDRHGRKYWFMARRVIVESETECWYYTTKKQLGELIYCLEGESYEVDLLNALQYNKEEFERQMEVTEELTNAAAAHRRTWLEIEDLAIDRLNEERVAIVEQEKAERERVVKEEADRLAKIEEEKQRAEEDKRRKEEEERRRVREERLAKRTEAKAKLLEEGELAAINDLIREQEAAEAAEREREAAEAQKKAEEDAQAKEDKEKQDAADVKKEIKSEENGTDGIGGTTENGKKDPDASETSSTTETPTKKPTPKSTLAILIAQESDRTTRLKSHPPFKLGQPPINYVNSYSTDPLALSKHQHQEERDRKRYTSHKFSLTTASDFKWFGQLHGDRTQLSTTLRATLLTLEALLPTTLLHVNWAALRRTWMTQKDFKCMILELVDCLRCCLFNPVWVDQAGHLRLKRQSMMEREEKKKWEKIDKKRGEDEEERLRYLGIVNYTIPIKHQVFKQKGEEYRIHGQYGWIWRSSIRPTFKSATKISSKAIPLSAGPQKHLIQVKAEDGLSLKTMLIEPSVYSRLMAKRERILGGDPTGIRYDRVRLADGRVVPFGKHYRAKLENVDQIVGEVVEDLLENIEDVKPEDSDSAASAHRPGTGSIDLIDVSRGLVVVNRVQFPKIAHGAPVCDGLLVRRLRAGAAEEKELLRKFGVTTARSCYSPTCRAGNGGTCYSPLCTPAKVTAGKQLREEKHYTTGDTSLKISLKKVLQPPKPGTPAKPVRLSPTFATGHGRSVFVLARWELRKLARSGGRSWTPPNFNSVKAWGPYPCGRPNFKTAWLWRTATGKGFGAMALQLRILWACIRWDDLQAKPPLEGKSQVTTDTDIITYEILGHRIVGRFMERVQYLRKKHILPLDGAPSVKTVVVKDTSPTTPISSRHGLRKRKRLQEPSSPNPSVLEEWVDEDKLELWEIRYYGERKQTRAKSGLTPNRPDKYDPSPTNNPPLRSYEREPPPPGTKRILDHAAVAEVLDNKVQHISKRNHARNNNEKDARAEIKETTTGPPAQPTASELLQQSIAARAFCTPEAAKAASKIVAGRKFFVSKAKESLKAQEPPKAVPPAMQTTNINLTSATTGQTTRLTVFKGEDGRLQIKGLLPGQHCYQTADGRLHIVGSPAGTAQPSRVTLPPEQQKAVPVPMITSTTSLPGASPVPQTFPQTLAPAPRLISTQPRLVAVSSTAPRPATIIQQQPQQRVLVTNAAGQQQIILAGGQQFLIRSQGPQVVQQSQAQTQQQQLLPISIVSPSKQQTQPQQVQIQQQPMRVIVGPDGVQYIQQQATTSATGGPQMINLVRRQIQLPSGQIVQVQMNEAPSSSSAPIAVKSPPPSATTVPHPATLTLQRPPLVLRLPTPPPLVQPSSIGVNIAAGQQQQRPLILRRLMRPVTAAQLAELQSRGLVAVRPQITTNTSVPGTPPSIVFASSPSTSAQVASTTPATVKTDTPPKPVVLPPVRMSTPPPVIPGLEKPVATLSMDKSPVIAVKSSPVKLPLKETPPPPPPPAIIGLDMKVEETASPVTTPIAVVSTQPKPVSTPTAEPLKTPPPKINLPPLPPPPEIPLAPLSSAASGDTPAAPPEKKVSRRKAVHTPYVEMKPPTPAAATPQEQVVRAAEPIVTATGLTQRQRALLFQHKENLKEDIMMKRALLEASLQRQIQAALKPATPPKAAHHETTKYTCSCGQAITTGQFYVSCAGDCTRFFHGSCVGITRQDLNQGKVYTCDKCKDEDEDNLEIDTPAPRPAKRGRGRKKGWSPAAAKQQQAAVAAVANTNTSGAGGDDKELYCLCKQPYDDSHFYIGCDDCQDWFHGRCVGILPVEGTSITEYKCPSCNPKSPYNRANFKTLTTTDMESLRRFMQQILERQEADDFYDSVDPVAHPNYRKIIREPMELKTMEQRIMTGRYTRLVEFVADACRIFDNCRHYNQATSPICKKATVLENFFLQKLRMFRQKLLADAE